MRSRIFRMICMRSCLFQIYNEILHFFVSAKYDFKSFLSALHMITPLKALKMQDYTIALKNPQNLGKQHTNTSNLRAIPN